VDFRIRAAAAAAVVDKLKFKTHTAAAGVDPNTCRGECEQQHRLRR
jgi:hypothetical protein